MEGNQIQIPDGWDEVKLGNILTKVKNGYSGEQVNHITNYPVSRIETISDGIVNLDRVGFVKNIPSNFKLINGDMLFSNINSIKHIGKIAFVDDDINLYHGMNLLLFQFDESLDKKFLYFKLISKKSWFEMVATQAINQASINQTTLKELKLIIPISKTEQTTIANILSKTDQAIALTEALIAKYSRIKTGLMQDLLTKGIDENGNIRSEQTHEFKDSPLGRIPKEWKCEVLRSYVSYISYGFTNPMPESLEGPYLITAANINKGRILYETSRKTTYKAYKELLTQKSRPIINDVLITKDGSIGRLAIVDSENLCINQSVAIIRVRNEKVDPTYFKMLLESNKYQDLIMADSGGSTIKHIYITKIDKMFLAIPTDSNEQTRILSILKSQDEIIEITQNQLSKLQSLKTGLMQDLLSGKVRVKN